MVAWALHVFIVRLAATVELYRELSDDCAGDVLEFFGMTHLESELIATHCSSPEARAWVHAVIAAAVVVGAIRCFCKKDCVESRTSSYNLYTLLSLCSHLLFRKWQRLSWCRQLKKATWRPCRTAFQKRPTLRLKRCVRSLPVMCSADYCV